MKPTKPIIQDPYTITVNNGTRDVLTGTGQWMGQEEVYAQIEMIKKVFPKDNLKITVKHGTEQTIYNKSREAEEDRQHGQS